MNNPEVLLMFKFPFHFDWESVTQWLTDNRQNVELLACSHLYQVELEEGIFQALTIRLEYQSDMKDFFRIKPAFSEILNFADRIILNELMCLPHPSIIEKSWVAVTVNDIDGDWCHPVVEKKISEILKENDEIENLDFLQNKEVNLKKLLVF